MYRIKLMLNILFCAISLLLFYFSPNVYSYLYCLLILILFILFNVSLFSFGVRKEGISFEFIFMISFFMTNFVYPIFYFPDNPTISLFGYGFNYNIITKSTALALVAYSFYILGVSPYNKKYSVYKEYDFQIGNTNVILLLFICGFSFLSFVIFGGLKNLINVYSGEGGRLTTVGSYSYFFNLFEISCLLLSIFVFKIKNNPMLKVVTLVFLMFTLLLLLSTGSRAIAIGNVLILLISYSKNVKKIPLVVASFWAILGANILYFIMLVRSFGVEENNSLTNAYGVFSSTGSYFDPFLDLIINNRNLYVLTDFVDDFGYVYFINNIYNLISFLPFNSKIIDILNIPAFLQQGNFPTYLEFGDNAGFGLGTNMVGEAYLSFGVFGVFVAFFGLGWFVKYIKNRSYNNIYYYVLFFSLLSMAVMLPRTASLPNSRYFIWPLILIFLITVFNRMLVRNSGSFK